MARHLPLLATLFVIVGNIFIDRAPEAQNQDRTVSATAGARFEVASIKPTEPGRRGSLWGPEPGGRWRMVNVPIEVIVKMAFGSRTMQLINAPDWVSKDPYDVNAKAENSNPTADEMNGLLRNLLLDRCKLVAHVEPRRQPVYALVVARSDGKLGPALKPSRVDCDAFNAARQEGRQYEGPAPANGASPCGWQRNDAVVRVGGLPMRYIAEAFGRVDGRVVVDKTGLTGPYEFTLEYAVEGGPATDLPSLFTALQEHLGLKLVADSAVMDVLVVDHIERPTAN